MGSATGAQLALKFVFANVVEVKLVEADQLMKMHPVIILLAVTFFGFIWGPTGMLLSVPLVAYAKVIILSDSIPRCYRDPLLILLEGDRGAPANYDQAYAQKRKESPDAEKGSGSPHASSHHSTSSKSGRSTAPAAATLGISSLGGRG